jgi:glucose/arabinose dehydrogenase
VNILPFALSIVAILSLAACGEESTQPISATTGRKPTLAEPKSQLIPTVNIAPARGWPEGGKPKPAAGLAVSVFAANLDHPRWLYVLPNGDVLVAETTNPRAAAAGADWRVGLWAR